MASRAACKYSISIGLTILALNDLTLLSMIADPYDSISYPRPLPRQSPSLPIGEFGSIADQLEDWSIYLYAVKVFCLGARVVSDLADYLKRQNPK